VAPAPPRCRGRAVGDHRAIGPSSQRRLFLMMHLLRCRAAVLRHGLSASGRSRYVALAEARRARRPVVRRRVDGDWYGGWRRFVRRSGVGGRFSPPPCGSIAWGKTKKKGKKPENNIKKKKKEMTTKQVNTKKKPSARGRTAGTSFTGRWRAVRMASGSCPASRGGLDCRANGDAVSLACIP